MQEANLLEGLTATQTEAVTSLAEPLVIIAGAGSGKTRVLTRRIAWMACTGQKDASHVLAVTFTRKAAGELRHRLATLGLRDRVATGTFHGLAYAQLRRRWADKGEKPPTLLERKVTLLAQLAPRSSSQGGGRAPRSLLSDLAAEVEWAKARLVSPEAYVEQAERAGRRPPLPPTQTARIYERYESEKRRRQLVDFDDLLVLCTSALGSDADFAAALRWRFRHIYVDEAQDANPAQWKLLEAWLGGRADLCLVGDPDQAIYSWNGADPGLLAGFPRRHPSTTVISLEENWRSTPEVLGAATAALGRRRASSRSSLTGAQRPSGPPPGFSSHDDEQSEGRFIARRLRTLHAPGTNWKDLAVLARTNSQLVVLGDALNRAHIPFRLPEGSSLLAQTEVKEALAFLRRSSSRPVSSWMADLQQMVNDASDAGAGAPGGDDRRLNLEALLRLADDYAAMDPLGTQSGFAQWLAATVRSEPAELGDAVDLSTFHRAKGLEWEGVFLAGLEDGLVPIAQASDPAAEDEERRLLYVAATRARTHLHCSWAKRRTFGTRTLSRRPSPYLERMRSTVFSSRKAPERQSSLERIRDERGRLLRSSGGRAGSSQLGTADSAVVAELRAWRASTAKASGVPAYVVLHDSTLMALAAQKPSTEQDLLAVPGLGPVKVTRYGRDLLALLQDRASA